MAVGSFVCDLGAGSHAMPEYCSICRSFAPWKLATTSKWAVATSEFIFTLVANFRFRVKCAIQFRKSPKI